MRWDELFADIDAQWEAAEAAELTAEIADRARREAAQLGLADRVAAAVGTTVAVRLVTGEAVTGTATSTGPDWMLLAENGRSTLVPLRSVLWVAGLGRHSVDPSQTSRVAAKLDLRYALRRLVRDRGDVLVGLTDSSRLTGTLVRIGSDFLDLAELDTRDASRTAAWTIPLASIVFLRST